MAQNIKYKSTMQKHDRFLYYANSLYCEEIGLQSFKNFVAVWMTA